MSTITTGDDASIGLEKDAAGPQVLKNRFHKFTDEENRMRPIAAGRVAAGLACVAVGRR
jgi:hypothetical protein